MSKIDSRQLQDAILSGYKLHELRQVLARYGYNLEHIVPERENLKTIVFELVGYFERQNKSKELLRIVYSERESNEAIRILALKHNIVNSLKEPNPSSSGGTPPSKLVAGVATILLMVIGGYFGVRYIPTLFQTTPEPTKASKQNEPVEIVETSTPSPTFTTIPEPTNVPELIPSPIVGQIGGRVTEVFVRDNIAYVGEGARLVIYDVTNRENPILLGKSEPLFPYFEKIEVVANIAYAVLQWKGLVIFDVSNPAAPFLVSSLDLQSQTWDVEIENNIAYIANGYSGLFIVDVSNNSSPEFISSLPLPYANDVEIRDNVVFITDGNEGLVVVDISDLESPKRINTLSTDGVANHLQIIDNTAFVSDRINGLIIVDISDPTSPTIIKKFSPLNTEHSFEVQIVGTTAYLADGYNGLVTVDISDLANPRLINNLNADVVGYTQGVYVEENIAYIASHTGFGAVDITNPDISSNNLNFLLRTAGQVTDVDVVDNIAYVADLIDGLVIMDVSDPTSPVVLSTCNDENNSCNVGAILDIQIVEGKAFLAKRGEGLVIVNVDDPLAPYILGTKDAKSLSTDGIGRAYGVHVVDNIAFMVDLVNGLVIMDVSDPSTPSIIGNLNTDGEARGIQVVNDIAFIADGSNGLLAVDVTNLESPTLLDRFGTAGEAKDVQIVNDLAYVAGGTDGLIIIDSSNPNQLERIHSYNTGDAISLSVVGNTVLIADGRNGLLAIDVTNPKQSLEEFSFPSIGSHAVQMRGDHIYLANQTEGLYILKPDSGFINNSSSIPVIGWSFEECSGDTATDSFNRIEAKLPNSGVQFGTDNKLGGCYLQFDGVEGTEMTVPYNQLFEHEQGTLMAWVYLEHDRETPLLQTIRGYFLEYKPNEEGDGKGRYFGMVYDLDSERESDWTRVSWADSTVNIGEWHHVTLTWDNSNLTMYQDGGTVVESVSYSAPPKFTQDSFIFGNSRNTASVDHVFEGRFDEVRIYDRALSADEILSEYNSQKDGY